MLSPKVPYYSTATRWSPVYLLCWILGFAGLLFFFILFSADAVAFYPLSALFFGYIGLSCYVIGTRPRAIYIYPDEVIIRKFFGRDIVLPLDSIVSVRMLGYHCLPLSCLGDFSTSFTDLVQLFNDTRCNR